MIQNVIEIKQKRGRKPKNATVIDNTIKDAEIKDAEIQVEEVVEQVEENNTKKLF